MEEQLKIRIEVETAKVRELKDAMKAVNAEMLDAPREKLPALRKELEVIRGVYRELIGAGEPLTNILRRQADETGRLTRFMRDQRSEQRAHTFFYRQLKDVLGSGALAVSAFSASSRGGAHDVKLLAGAVESGFVAFQGVNFLLSGVNPVIGLTTSLVAGLAGALLSLDESGTKSKHTLQRIDDITKALANVTPENVDAIKDYVNFLSGSKEREIQREVVRLREDETDVVSGLARAMGGQQLVERTNLEVARHRLGVGKEIKKLTDEEFLQMTHMLTPVIITAETEEGKVKRIKSGNDKIMEQLELEELRLQAGVTSIEQYNERLRASLDTLSSEKERLAIQLKLNESLELEARVRKIGGLWMKAQGVRPLSARGFGRDGKSRPVAEVGSTAEPAFGTFPSDDEAEMLRRQMERYWPLIDSLESGFARVGASIQTEFIDKIIGSTSLFQQFVGGVLAGITSIGSRIASSAAISGILSLIPGVGSFAGMFSELSGLKFAHGGVITEPVVGMGTRSKRPYLMGENGPERVSPLTSFSRGGQALALSISGTFRVDGRDLLGVVKQNVIIDRRLGGRML